MYSLAQVRPKFENWLGCYQARALQVLKGNKTGSTCGGEILNFNIHPSSTIQVSSFLTYDIRHATMGKFGYMHIAL